jgi:hypothetical protein
MYIDPTGQFFSAGLLMFIQPFEHFYFSPVDFLSFRGFCTMPCTPFAPAKCARAQLDK